MRLSVAGGAVAAYLGWAKTAALFFRVTRTGRHQDVQIARRDRDGGAVKQQTLLSLGRLAVLQASGQLAARLRSGLRLSRRRVRPKPWG